MASASSSAARLLIRDGKSAASLLFRSRTANLTEAVQNTGPAIRSLLRLNQMPASQFPVFSETFPVMQSGFRVGFIQQEAVSERRGKMEAGQGNDSEEDSDFDEEDFDDIDMDDDDEFDDTDEDDEEDDDKSTRNKKK